MAMLSNGTIVGDGSWVLRIHVTDINVDREFRVKGDMHIGGVMLRLVDDLDITRDWSDHALWWPQRNKWLSHTRSTLDQYGVTAESLLEFTPMHKYARVQLPDLQYITARLDYSVPVFNAVMQLCKEIGCRHPEELSLKRYIDPESLIKQTPVPSERRDLGYTLQTQYQLAQMEAQKQTLNKQREKDAGYTQSQQNLSASTAGLYTAGSPAGGVAFGQHPQPYPPPAVAVAPGSTLSLNRAGSVPPTPSHAVNNTPIISPYAPTNYGTLSSHVDGTGGTLPRSATATPAIRILTSPSWEASLVAENYDEKLVHSPRQLPIGAMATQHFRPKNYVEKAALNRGWLDSSRSLMEQGILENDLLLLRFKFMLFFDLNPKYDPVRINQIYEQSKWSLLLEEIDCTEEEAFMFAALQLQIQLRTELKQNGEAEPEEDDVDVMLNELESVLEGTVISKHGDITSVPELADYLRFLKPKKLALKNWRRAFFTFKDLNISWYNSANESYQQPIGRVFLKGCEVTHEVNLSEAKYLIKLLIPSAEGMSEFWLRCDSEQQYAKWLAGCKLAAKGKTMADAGYQAEVESIRRLLAMQHSPSETQPVTRSVQAPQNLNPEEYLPSRYAKKARGYAVQRILEAHKNVNELPLTDAKLQYIRAWQALPEQSIHYFVVRFRNGKKAELLGIAFNRMMRMNLDTAESIKTWRFADIDKWHVNWEIKRIFIQHVEENLEFSCLSSDCKVPHEFIGGYIFVGMRSKDQNQILNTELFHKLTGGWT